MFRGLIFADILISAVAGFTCPSGWTNNPWHSSCVKVFTSTRTWLQARDDCAHHNSTLAHLDSPLVYILLGNLAGNTFTWLAANDLAEEGVFRGVGGQVMNYLPWDPSGDQPNGLREQNGVAVWHGGLHDKATVQSFHFVCEMWREAVRTAVLFQRMSIDFLLNTNIGFDNNTHFRMATDNTYACALECRKQRPLCDAFVISPAAKDCHSLRLFDVNDPNVLDEGEIISIANVGASVYFMIG